MVARALSPSQLTGQDELHFMAKQDLNMLDSLCVE